MERNQIPYFSENCSIQHINWDTTLDNSDMITNPYDIANTFNNYFASIAEILSVTIMLKLLKN